jgi:hypothetical protein
MEVFLGKDEATLRLLQMQKLKFGDLFSNFETNDTGY